VTGTSFHPKSCNRRRGKWTNRIWSKLNGGGKYRGTEYAATAVTKVLRDRRPTATEYLSHDQTCWNEVERKDALKRTSSIAEIIMKSIRMIHRTEKAIRISIGAGSNSVSTVGKWGIESSSAIDRKKEARIVAGRKKRKHG
jgi:hypothetical protein